MASHNGVVLAIDDDPMVLETLAGALGRLGYEVLQSTNGADGFRLAVDHDPDVVLLDVVMPAEDGYEVCRKLKADCRTQLIPVVFLTGQESRDAMISGLEAGASDFLRKPCDLAELEARVRNLVSFHQMTLDLESAEEVIFTLARLLEARDRDTGDHCVRLAGLCERLGERLGLDDDQMKTLRRGAFLHDVGKVAIPDEVLLKPGPLDGDDWEKIKRHAVIGSTICAPLKSLQAVLPLIRHHHERFNGSGYPDGIAAEKIPYLARVFQVVDVYDALTNDRPYRGKLPAEEAVEIIRDETRRGYWDPAIVDQFLEMVRSGEPGSPSGNAAS